MLTIYRSNRAEWLASLFSQQLQLEPPEPLEQVDVVVNTWPTSRWLGDQISISTGINAQINFPFPGAYFKKLVRTILGLEAIAEDPWRANNLVWPVIDLMPVLLQADESAYLKKWLNNQKSNTNEIDKQKWQLARLIADAIDDYILYRPELINAWIEIPSSRFSKLPEHLIWQPFLVRLLAKKISTEPFCLQVRNAIQRLKEGLASENELPNKLYFFGLSSLAPIQIEVMQALSGLCNIKVFLLTPCPDLWQRCKSRREGLVTSWNTPLDGEWLLEAPRIEANLGRLGAEFQQLLEGTGESQLGTWEEGDLFAAPCRIAETEGREATLLEQIQQNLVTPSKKELLQRNKSDKSLLFLACPGQRRQVQLIRDQLIQLLAEDDSLQPRDILIMTPQIEHFAPLIASVFNDVSATDIDIPWKITDRNPEDSPGLIKYILELLELAAGRFTATDLDSFLENPVLQEQEKFSGEDVQNVSKCLQATGFRWGLDKKERLGDEEHSLSWCLDRWLLGLILPSEPGLAPDGVAPFSEGIDIKNLTIWWSFLSKLLKQIKQLRVKHSIPEWVELLKTLAGGMFSNTDTWAWEKQSFYKAIEDWRKSAEECTLEIEVNVIIEVLKETLSTNSSRFGHRSGKITISALEPMRAIPHKVIVLMGLDTTIYPQHNDRPSFHFLEQSHELGDPRGSHQDRYVLLEALMSTRQNLLITWNCRNERTGEEYPPSSPIQQWIDQLKNELSAVDFEGLVQYPHANPLDRSNFIVNHQNDHPISCDKRDLDARQWLDNSRRNKKNALSFPIEWSLPKPSNFEETPPELVKNWINSPQLSWLDQLQIKPRTWNNPVENLESLELKEFKRKELLTRKLEKVLESNIKLITPEKGNWRSESLGQGIFPPEAAGEIENEILENRWLNLQSTILKLGACQYNQIESKNETFKILQSERASIVVEMGRFNYSVGMQGWLLHLKLCSNSSSQKSTLIIAKSESRTKRNCFEIALRWKAISPEKANHYLDILGLLATHGMTKCWPVPPESGWAYVSKNIDGSADSIKEFETVWNGTYSLKGERNRPEMQICFGEDCEASDIINSKGFRSAINALYSPIFENLEKTKN